MKYTFSILTTLVLSFSCATGMDNTKENTAKPRLSDKQVAVTEKSGCAIVDQKTKNIKTLLLSQYVQEKSQDSQYYRDLDEWAYGDIDSWGNR